MIGSACLLGVTPVTAPSTEATPAPALRFAIAGLVHGHAQGFSKAEQKRTGARVPGLAHRSRPQRRGALFDFGCYGANLKTWLMDEQRPLAVTAGTQQIKPAIYPRVDDEATVLLEYPRAQGIIQASWNWPFSRKDLEVYGEKGYAGAIGGATLRVHLPGQTEEALSPEPRPIDERDAVSYLIAVTRGRRVPSGLSSLANNVIVVEILEAARESARLRRTIWLQP